MFARSIKKLEIAFKNFEVTLGSLFFDTPQRRTEPLDSSSIKNILLIRPDKLGDMAITIPVLETIHKNLPGAQIDILASPRNVSLVKDDRRIRNIFLYRKRPFRDWRTLRRMKKTTYDIILDLVCHDSVTAVFLSQYIGGKTLRAGFGKIRLAKFYNFHLPVDVEKDEHMIDVTLASLWPLGIKRSAMITQAPLHFNSATEKQIEGILEGFRSRSNEPDQLLGINISAGAPNRWWGVENYQALVKELKRKAPDMPLVVLSVPAERAHAKLIAESCAGVNLLPGGLDIMAVAGVISHLRLLITPDTSLTHIARNFNVPVVGLYSTHRRNTSQWRPYNQSGGVAQGSHADDIFDILPEQVVTETMQMLTGVRDVAV